MTESAELRRLVDEAAIRRVLLAYCRGIDRADIDLLASVYHSDSVDVHGGYHGDGAGFAAYVADRHREMFATMHLIGDSFIELDDDVAHTETYVRANHVVPGEPWRLELFFGRYLDRLERRAGVWRIARRVVMRDFMGTVPIEPMMGVRDFDGRRDRTDDSYRHLRFDDVLSGGPGTSSAR